MRTHGGSRRFRFAPYDVIQNTLMVNLPALRAALDLKDLLALFAQQIYDRVYEDDNKGVLSGLRQRLVKTIIGGNESIGVVQAFVHGRNRLAHSSDLFFGCPRG